MISYRRYPKVRRYIIPVLWYTFVSYLRRHQIGSDQITYECTTYRYNITFEGMLYFTGTGVIPARNDMRTHVRYTKVPTVRRYQVPSYLRRYLR